MEISNTKEINHNILERKKEREKSKKILNFTTQTLNKTGKVHSSLLRSYQGYVKTEKKKKTSCIECMQKQFTKTDFSRGILLFSFGSGCCRQGDEVVMLMVLVLVLVYKHTKKTVKRKQDKKANKK